MLAAALPPLTPLRALTSWRLEPGVLAAVVALAGGYLIGLRRRREPWPRRHTGMFLAGVAMIALVGLSFTGVYDDTLFWTRAVQNLVLVMVAPMLLALGSPVRLVADLLPSGVRTPCSGLLHSRTARMLTFPLLVTLLLVVPLLVVYTTPLYPLTLRSPLTSGLVGTVLAITGFLYFWTRLGIDPTPRVDPHLLTLWLTVVETIGDAVIGVVLWFGPLVASDHYRALDRAWGPSLRTNQQIGAVVIWVGGDVVGLPFVGVIFSLMAAEDTRRAAVVDATLDAADADRGGPGDRGPARLWWEDDPQLAERFRRR